MKYKVNWAGGDGVFAVPDAAADFLKLANGKAVKVLLYILKNKLSEIDLSAVGEAVGASPDDVEDALSYWQQVGIIFPDGSEPAEIHSPKTVKPNTLTVQSESNPAKLEHERSIKKLSAGEIADRLSESESLKILLDTASSTLGRLLNHTEQQTLIWLHDYYNIAPDILIMIISFAKQINKASIGYIEKTAVNWHEKGITTHEQASAEIICQQNYFSLEGQVAAKLKLKRAFTTSESKYIKDWAAKNISIDLIVYAYEKMIDTIGELKFSYMNKILLSWYEKGINTVKEAQEDNSQKVQKAAKSVKDSGNHSYDLDRIMEHAMNNSPKIKKN